MLTNCKYCNSLNLIKEEQIFDGKKRVRVECGECGKFQEWEAYIDDVDFEMPFGKHSGKKLTQIVEQDRDYALWASKKLGNNIKNRFLRLLKTKNKPQVQEFSQTAFFD